ncbi:hypothetical protein CE91St65_05090 [[Clostridium] symbiosum]|nr:restriction endonuclease subunit S [[Clostridium] innocuum]BDF22629.1 hypothetical protein CE91St65_05090 [[Clostridium] symbiosum]
MSEWKKTRLGDVISTNIASYSTKEGWEFVNYLDTGNITENVIADIQRINLSTEKLPSRAKRKVQYNSILYSTVRPNQRHYGIVKESPENFLVSTGFTVIDVDEEKVDADFLYFLLTQDSLVELLHSIAEQSVSAYPSIKASDIENLEVELPPLIEQKKIASILNTISDKMRQNTEVNKNLEEQASAIYQAWFEDFTPFDGNCPAEWKQGVLSDIANVTSGKRPPMKSAEKTDIAPIPLVGAASVMGFTSESNHVDKILVTGRVGTHGVVQRFSTPCWTSDNTLVITSDLYEYTYQILQRIDYHAMNRGSTQPLITQGDMNKVAILIPDRQTLDDFEALVGQLMLQCEANLLENAKLTELRDSLLPRLMSGELDVSDIDF